MTQKTCFLPILALALAPGLFATDPPSLHSITDLAGNPVIGIVAGGQYIAQGDFTYVGGNSPYVLAGPIGCAVKSFTANQIGFIASNSLAASGIVEFTVSVDGLASNALPFNLSASQPVYQSTSIQITGVSPVGGPPAEEMLDVWVYNAAPVTTQGIATITNATLTGPGLAYAFSGCLGLTSIYDAHGIGASYCRAWSIAFVLPPGAYYKGNAAISLTDNAIGSGVPSAEFTLLYNLQ
jgi:hypothetical protein